MNIYQSLFVLAVVLAIGAMALRDDDDNPLAAAAQTLCVTLLVVGTIGAVGFGIGTVYFWLGTL
jgi:hypothetical protein